MVFLFILLIIFIFFLAIVTGNIKFKIKNFQFNSNKKEYINSNFSIKIVCYLFWRIPCIKINITKQKILEIMKNEKVKKLLKKQKNKIFMDKNNIDKKLLKNIQDFKININEANLKINIGTENAAITALLVPLISIGIITFCVNKIKKANGKQQFEVNPVYINQNLINILFSGIFEIKVLHIINTICKIKKEKRGGKDERTSNRRTYDYSYE